MSLADAQLALAALAALPAAASGVAAGEALRALAERRDWRCALEQLDRWVERRDSAGC